MRRLSILIPAVLFLLALTTPAALAQDPTAGQEAWEKQVWQCQRCHGAAGEGLYGRPLSNSTATAQEWIDQVRQPRRNMPAFSAAQVSDQQIIDMHAYVTALPDPTGEFKPKDPGTAPDPGQNLMLQKRCVSCHEDVATTGQGLLIEGFIKRGITPTADVVIKQLRTPFKNMPAYRPEQVSDEEATQIATFLATQVAAQSAPTDLPQSGGASTANLPLWLALAGSGLALAGLALRQKMIKE
jgi:ubiquinol-cytochrome c reductase cytochrome c subunit